MTSDFKKDVENLKESTNQFYSLNIVYDSYKYDSYISYAFFSEYNIGGAHPTHNIWTIVYNADTNEVIDIDKLNYKYPNILNILSDYSRKVLKKDPKIINFSMMFNGTIPKKMNYSNFCFTSNGLLIFFERYQVAPYSSGNFVVTVPYNKFM